MQFCNDCGNILLPKKRTNELYCRVCKTTIPLEEQEAQKLEEYKKGKGTNNPKKSEKKRAMRTAVITEYEKAKSMTEEDREAFGEIMEFSEE